MTAILPRDLPFTLPVLTVKNTRTTASPKSTRSTPEEMLLNKQKTELEKAAEELWYKGMGGREGWEWPRNV